jgi:release factor glutamine methyltransferase
LFYLVEISSDNLLGGKKKLLSSQDSMSPEKDTILYVLTKSQEFLKSKSIPNPRLDAEILLAEVLNLSRVLLYAKFDQKLTEEQKDIYRNKIKDRGEHKPVAYILGKKSFYKYDFKVSPDVLIPRPETEELIEWVLQENPPTPRIEVLDLCTGSGCIGICLSKERSEWKLSASDLSPSALEVARQNASLLQANLDFFESDLFSHLPPQKFAVIVSNPPYIPIEEKESLESDVKDFEPHLALFLENPLDFYKNLLISAKSFLRESGKFYLETHPLWAAQVQKMALDLQYSSAVIRKDLSKKERFLRLDV